MNDKFDELTKGLAQSVTRRGALKKFWLGLAAMLLATLGLTNKTEAQDGNSAATPRPRIHCRCKEPEYGCDLQSPNSTLCLETCMLKCGP